MVLRILQYHPFFQLIHNNTMEKENQSLEQNHAISTSLAHIQNHFMVGGIEVVRHNGVGSAEGVETYLVTKSPTHDIGAKTNIFRGNLMPGTYVVVERENPSTLETDRTSWVETCELAGLGEVKMGTYSKHRYPPTNEPLLAVNQMAVYEVVYIQLVYRKDGTARQVVSSSQSLETAYSRGSQATVSRRHTFVSKEALDPVLIDLGDSVLFAGRAWEKEKAVALFKDIVDKGCIGDVRAIMEFLYPSMYITEDQSKPIVPSLVFDRMINLMRTVIQGHGFDPLAYFSS